MIKINLFFRAWSLFFWVLSTGGMTACGGLKKGKLESSSLTQGVPLNFQVSVLSAKNSNAQLPAEGVSFVAQQDRMVLPQTFHLGDSEGRSRSLWLAWPETFGSTLILDAHFSHRVQNALNQNQGEEERWSASWDQENRRWFLSINRLFEGRETQLNPADVHWFNFDFLLKEGTHRTIQLGLKLMGPPPQLRFKFIEPSHLQQPSGLIQSFYSSWSFHEQWENSTDRKLTFWLLPEEKTGLQFRTELKVPRFVERKNQEPLGPFPEYHESSVPLSLTALNVNHGNGLPGGFYSFPRILKKVSPWVKIQLDPRETLTLEWKVSAGQRVTRCQVPEPEIHEFHWKLVQCGLFLYLPLDQCPHSTGVEFPQELTKKVIEDWSITSALVEGDFKREVRISDAVVEFPEEGVLASDRIPIRVLGGENPHSAGRFPCQGIF